MLVLEEYFFSNTVAERASRFWTGHMGWDHSESVASQAFWRQRAIDVALAFDEFVLLAAGMSFLHPRYIYPAASRLDGRSTVATID